MINPFSIQQFLFFLILSFIISCKDSNEVASEISEVTPQPRSTVSLIVLGTIQDAGSPHIACKKECCEKLFDQPDPNRKVVSLGLVDHENNKSYVFEATPDFPTQVKKLKHFSSSENELPNGIFLTHAHIGHYSGLMYLGKEATNAHKIPVYTMPRMKIFLEDNGPWSQLVVNENIEIKPMNDSIEVSLTSNIRVTPILVPHRDEYSETVGYIIRGPSKKVLFIPDIDKWSKWKNNISEVIREVDYAFLDATFYDGEEINTRDISEIPHPFMIESMQRFNSLPLSEKQKIHFIHFNHTNPVLDSTSGAYQTTIKSGYNIAGKNRVLEL
ncbi:MAG: MBL fold metallo-hydrolase [Flavobacteriaceae bacterium]|nr:MBL fold metallo-hydrolase [Flavobacteriaceae bacterium]